jgi:hypothetical protein
MWNEVGELHTQGGDTSKNKVKNTQVKNKVQYIGC